METTFHKMKLSVSILSFQDWSLEEFLRTCSQNGISAIELRLNLSPWSTLDTEEARKDILDLLHKYNMTISDIGTNVCVNTYKQEALEQLRRDMILAQSLGTKGLRIMFGSWRSRWSETGSVFDYEGICRWIIEADRMAEEYDREIWIETHYEMATGKMLRQLFDDCKLQHCKIVWDVMHPLEQQESIPDTYAYIRDYLVHIHIKDGSPWPDPDLANWKYAIVGEGQIPLREIVNLVLADGYKGYFSLEWESYWHEEIRGLDNSVILTSYPKFMERLIISDKEEEM